MRWEGGEGGRVVRWQGGKVVCWQGEKGRKGGRMLRQKAERYLVFFSRVGDTR